MKRLLLFVSLHLFLFLLVFAFHAQADDYEWSIDDYDNMVVASVPGKIIHGDKLRFVLTKGDCNYVNVLFSFLTFNLPKKINDLKDKRIPIKINEEEVLAAADVVLIYPTLDNRAHFIMLTAPQVYELNNFSEGIMASYNAHKNYSIELMDDEKIEFTKYFDVLVNEWDLEKYPEKINQAREKCLENVITDIKLSSNNFLNKLGNIN
jgi:hypothetical protein